MALFRNISLRYLSTENISISNSSAPKLPAAKLASMIVCNSETIRETLRDAFHPWEHDFRSPDLYSLPCVIVQLFCAARNETSAPTTSRSDRRIHTHTHMYLRGYVLVFRERIKIFYIIRALTYTPLARAFRRARKIFQRSRIFRPDNFISR